jgi:hypothetical protein
MAIRECPHGHRRIDPLTSARSDMSERTPRSDRSPAPGQARAQPLLPLLPLLLPLLPASVSPLLPPEDASVVPELSSGPA